MVTPKQLLEPKSSVNRNTIPVSHRHPKALLVGGLLFLSLCGGSAALVTKYSGKDKITITDNDGTWKKLNNRNEPYNVRKAALRKLVIQNKLEADTTETLVVENGKSISEAFESGSLEILTVYNRKDNGVGCAVEYNIGGVTTTQFFGYEEKQFSYTTYDKNLNPVNTTIQGNFNTIDAYENGILTTSSASGINYNGDTIYVEQMYTKDGKPYSLSFSETGNGHNKSVDLYFQDLEQHFPYTSYELDQNGNTIALSKDVNEQRATYLDSKGLVTRCDVQKGNNRGYVEFTYNKDEQISGVTYIKNNDTVSIVLPELVEGNNPNALCFARLATGNITRITQENIFPMICYDYIKKNEDTPSTFFAPKIEKIKDNSNLNLQKENIR